MGNRKAMIFLIAVIVVILVGAVVVYFVGHKKTTADSANQNSEQGNVAGVTTQDSSKDPVWIEGLAKYLTEKGMVMYGAYWCPHCQNQKKEFGDAVKYIDYVECDPAGTNANPDECKANNVTGYPTWVYQGKQYSGELSLEKLAEITGYNQ